MIVKHNMPTKKSGDKGIGQEPPQAAPAAELGEVSAEEGRDVNDRSLQQFHEAFDLYFHRMMVEDRKPAS